MNKEQLETLFQRPFRSSGDNWKGSCPFHDESTPSFLVHKEDYVAHCFGCGVGGTIDLLGARYRGIPASEARIQLNITGEDRLHVSQKVSQKILAPKTFPESWLAPFKKEVHKYVISRLFRPGILQRAETRYDCSLQRQVFPHRDREGGLLGVVGRACKGQDPKWLFYWDYKKGAALYTPFGIDPLRPTILVEGVFDYLWIYQRELPFNAAATLGTSSTAAQLAELKSYGTDVIIGFDNDSSGAGAGAHAYQELRKSTRTQFIQWPSGTHDWMDLERGAMEEVLENSKNPVELAFEGKQDRLVCDCRKHKPRQARMR